jgi:hypothetical protein
MAHFINESSLLKYNIGLRSVLNLAYTNMPFHTRLLSLSHSTKTNILKSIEPDNISSHLAITCTANS